ncbi:DUF397 domain-containing protein [Streptomyces albus subsp. chlorinus]|uniref:DUF397 domain-containing protein n=1 Tax=Streptomyces albus TaxID=1888 RepID=UPI001D1C944E|nr:DUF397 domain-containing protein [Streptomyces albus]NSC21368.1 DUF397 domain-containing protein [Streptomyces albus subsp. chlorinus]
MSETQWVKSSYSDQQGGNCVEWAPGLRSVVGGVPVRDSKDTGRGPLAFSPTAWQAFIEEVKCSGR